jgi:cysteine desulfurase/selenocysteine lyase
MHKMLGPSGMGILYGKEERLKELRPLMSGGGTVGSVTYDSVKMTSHPEKFEAGLMDYAGIMGTAAALEYLSKIGMKNIGKHIAGLQRTIDRELRDADAITTVGPEDHHERGAIYSFNIKGMGSHDVAVMLDNADGIMIRSGMHCAHPFFASRGLDGCARASLYIYNNSNDVLRFTSAVRKLAAAFSK